MKSERLSENKKIFLVFLGIVILGCALRIYHLGIPSLWCDELYTENRIRLQPPQIIESLRNNPFPPLYYMFMHYWVKLAGYSESSLRFPSVVCSVLTIIFIFILAKELFGKEVGIFSAFFVSISPFSIYYAQEAKMYSMLWLFGVLSFLFFYRLSKDNKTADLLLYILCTLAAIYTMYIGFIFMIIQNIAFFAFFERKRVRLWLLVQLTLLLLYLPWSDMFLYHLTHKTGTWWIPGVSNYFQLLFKTIIPRIVCGVIVRNNTLALGVYSLLLITAFTGITRAEKNRITLDFKKTDRLLLLWIIVPMVVYWLINTFICPMLSDTTERYIGFIYMPLCMLISKGINKYGFKIKSVLLTFLLFVTFSSQIFPLYAYHYRANRDDYRAFQRQIKLRAESNSLLLSELPFSTIAYYNKDYEIKPLGYIDAIQKQPVDKRPASIFVVYRYFVNYRLENSMEIPLLKNKLKGYKLIEIYFKYPNGFLWFKKSE